MRKIDCMSRWNLFQIKMLTWQVSESIFPCKYELCATFAPLSLPYCAVRPEGDIVRLNVPMSVLCESSTMQEEKKLKQWTNNSISRLAGRCVDVPPFQSKCCESDFGNFLTAFNMEIFTLSSIQCSRSPHRCELVRCSYGRFEIKISYESTKLFATTMDDTVEIYFVCKFWLCCKMREIWRNVFILLNPLIPFQHNKKNLFVQWPTIKEFYWETISDSKHSFYDFLPDVIS